MARCCGAGWEYVLVRAGRHWGLPKGHVEAGEAPARAALREVAEETGLPLDSLALRAEIAASEYAYRDREGRLVFKYLHQFVVVTTFRGELSRQESEIDEAAWFTLEAALSRASFPATRRALSSAAALLGAEPGSGGEAAPLQSSRVRLFDTLTGEVRPLVAEDGRVGMYVCGITPYDGGHLGHAFTYHTFDVLTRRLRMEGVVVRSVRNVTDVDDDILRVSRQRGLDWRELGETETARFDRDMAAIGILDVDSEPRASARVPAMVEWIESLVARGHAYGSEGWVYFDVRSYPQYGALSRLDRVAMLRLSAERGADPHDPRKRDPLDFVLWQPSLADEPAWPSPWSSGRPGWHIECTVLAKAELALPIDVHGGGDDLTYPHHESEIAQAHGGGVEGYVRHWVHVAMVGYRGEKMSKSLGNLVFVRDVLEPTSAAVVRLLLCAHHHRSAWEYTTADLDVAKKRAVSYAALLDERSWLASDRAQKLREDFLGRIDDDLDLPGALEVLDAAPEAVQTRVMADGVPAAAAVLPLLEVIGAGSLGAAFAASM